MFWTIEPSVYLADGISPISHLAKGDVISLA
jgi:hypothetical protein